jgi:tRNA pseudouridine55 synthase
MAAPGARPPRRRVDGVLLLDKPVGRSSNAVLQHVKWLYAAQKAGHAGTLDPLASGLLPVLFGEATKFAHGLLEARKAYVATVRFGVVTETGDAEGAVVSERAVAFARNDLQRVAGQFVGTVMQVPPRHSALKFQGRSYYEYARSGIEIPRAPRPVVIDAIDIVEWAPPLAVLRVTCGKGTYIRTLAEDIGAALGSGAHLAALRREATGPFMIDGAIGVDALEPLDDEGRDRLLLPAYAALAELPRVVVDAAAARALGDGRVVPSPGAAAGRCACFTEAGDFIGLVEARGEALHPVRLVRSGG